MENKQKFTDLMIDIETLGTKSNALILSVAIVEFNMITSEIGDNIYLKICINDSLLNDFKIEGDTLMWWMTQDNNAKHIFNNKYSIKCIDALTQLSVFLLNRHNFKIWGNSARFDLGLLQNYYNKFNMNIPWKYGNERDVRTLVDFYPNIKKELVFEGVKHDALADCFHQIKYCSMIYNKIKKDNI